MKILYLTNIHNPYRDEFFEQLGSKCDLTVLFEERGDSTRDASWFEGVCAKNYSEVFLPDGDNLIVSRSMLDLIAQGWSLVLVGCYNSLRQMTAIEYMKRRKIPYVINSDGLVFNNGNAVKRAIRRHVLVGADSYLIAGETCVPSLARLAGPASKIMSYPLTSLTSRRVNELAACSCKRDPQTVLVVGQFADYKGLDVALDAAKELDQRLRFRFVGTGGKTEEFMSLVERSGLDNIEVIPFLNQDLLIKEYQTAGLFVLPSRQECWGLVVNEAAACGCPIVSTWGSGAAVEFVSHIYPKLLAEPDSCESLASAICAFFRLPDSEKNDYSLFLKEKSAQYTIEAMVEAHLDLFAEITS